MKPLSEQLAELSVRAKGAENAFEGAKKEARDKIEARKAEALSAAKTAVEKVNQQIKSAGESCHERYESPASENYCGLERLKGARGRSKAWSRCESSRETRRALGVGRWFRDRLRRRVG